MDAPIIAQVLVAVADLALSRGDPARAAALVRSVLSPTPVFSVVNSAFCTMIPGSANAR